MKALLVSLALAAGALPVLGQTESVVEAERTRITAERNQTDARFAAQEVACNQTFAVNDCLKAARSQRRERLADLRRQELSLNDADRRRRAAERVRSIEERNSAQKQEEGAAQRAEAVARQRDKKEAVEQRAAERAKPAASAPARTAGTKSAPERKAVSRAGKEPRSDDTADELRRSQQRQQEATERRERVARRLAEAAKSGAKPLPVPQ